MHAWSKNALIGGQARPALMHQKNLNKLAPMQDTPDQSTARLPWVLEQNGIPIARFKYQTDCLNMIRFRAELVQDIARFRYYHEQERVQQYRGLGKVTPI